MQQSDLIKNNSTVELAKNKLNEWLENGLLTVGEKLPSERELEGLINVKRMTLRQALLSLEAESKIFRKDRKGWFVALPRFNYDPESSISFNLAAKQQGRVPSWGYMHKVLSDHYPVIAESLFLNNNKGKLYKISGWGALDNHKVFYHESFINPEVAAGFIDTLDNNSFFNHWLDRYGKKITISKLAFKPIRLSGDIGAIIDSSAGTPAILVEKYRADESGNIIQIDIEYWRFESVNFFINLKG